MVLEKRKLNCRRCGKKRLCANYNENYKIWKKVWRHESYYPIYGLWICKECADKITDEEIQNLYQKNEKHPMR